MKLADLPKFPPTFRGRYPGLEVESQRLMTTWLDKHQNEITTLYYNVHLYPEPAENPDLPAEELALWRELSALRIDAIAVSKPGNLLIEVAPSVSAATLGRLIAYTDRWKKQFPTDPLNNALLIYTNDNPVMLNAVRAQGFQLERL